VGTGQRKGEKDCSRGQINLKNKRTIGQLTGLEEAIRKENGGKKNRVEWKEKRNNHKNWKVGTGGGALRKKIQGLLDVEILSQESIP